MKIPRSPQGVLVVDRGGDMFDIDVDTSNLERVMRDFAKQANKEMDEIVEKQAGMLVGHLIALTPPAAAKSQAMNDSGGIKPEARKRGENRIKADLAVLFPTARMKPENAKAMVKAGYQFGTRRGRKTVKMYAESIADLRRIHQLARSKSSGRVRTGTTGQNMALTRAALKNEYFKMIKGDVGILSAGWMKAARKLQTAKGKTPAWITRHGTKPGATEFRHSKSGLTITIRNKMPYFPKDYARRFQRAIDRREYALKTALQAMLDRKAKRATQRMK
jgi:hypothetical protein